MVHRLFARQHLRLGKFRYRDQGTFPRADSQLQQLIDGVLLLGRQGDTDRNFLLGFAIVHRGHVFARQSETNDLDDVLLRHAEQCGLAL